MRASRNSLRQRVHWRYLLGAGAVWERGSGGGEGGGEGGSWVWAEAVAILVCVSRESGTASLDTSLYRLAGF